MSKRLSQLDKVQKLVDDIYSENNGNIAIFAVELDEKGFPLGRMQKVRATPGVALGALSMLEEAIQFRSLNVKFEDYYKTMIDNNVRGLELERLEKILSNIKTHWFQS